MRLHKCDFEYLYIWRDEGHEEENAKTQKKIDDRAALLAAMGVDMAEHSRGHVSNVLLSDSQMVECMVAGFEFKVKETRDYGRAPGEDLVGVLARFEAITEKLRAIPVPELTYNEKCEVHMPGQALSTYNEVALLEDACSDALQTHLDGGWRIIAACPQPDSRRPDYILGRFNPTREPERTAYAQRG